MLRTILIFGALSSFLVLLIELLEFGYQKDSFWADIFLIASALLFILTGFLINHLFTREKLDFGDVSESEDLSKQELKVLHLLNEGLSNRELAETLHISENTVKTHLSHIYSKLEARRRTEALKKARKLRLIQ